MKVIISLVILFTFQTHSKELTVYLDADLTNHVESGVSIKNGLLSAIDYYYQRNKNSKYKIKLKVLDHRGNTRRSLKNFKDALKDPNMLAVFGGLHSPPLITNKKFINENEILTLVPWAAGGPITRTDNDTNWIFRLSVDDSQAGYFITKTAINDGCKKPRLILEKTPWGKSNEKNMKAALEKFKVDDFQVSLFDWSATKSAAADISNSTISSKNDCIFFVGNANDATTILKSLGSSKSNARIYSHWGITSADSLLMSKLIFKNNLKLKLIQTSFSFLQGNLNEYQKEILSYIKTKYKFQSPKDIKPMSGWVHSFDLMTIMLQTLERIDPESSPKTIRSQLRSNLEKIDFDIKGLVKIYKKPFRADKSKNSHEALNLEDYVMRSYRKDGSIY